MRCDCCDVEVECPYCHGIPISETEFRGATCRVCREQGKRVRVTLTPEMRGTETIIKATCPECGYEVRVDTG